MAEYRTTFKYTAESHEPIDLLFGRLPLAFSTHHRRECFHCRLAIAFTKAFKGLNNLVDTRHCQVDRRCGLFVMLEMKKLFVAIAARGEFSGEGNSGVRGGKSHKSVLNCRSKIKETRSPKVAHASSTNFLCLAFSSALGID